MLTPLSGVARSGRCHLTSVLPFVSGCILLTDRSQEEPVAGFLALGSLPPLFPDSNQSKFALEIAEAASPWNPSQQLGMLCDFMTSGAADPTAELRRGIQGLQRSVGPVLGCATVHSLASPLLGCASAMDGGEGFPCILTPLWSFQGSPSCCWYRREHPRAGTGRGCLSSGSCSESAKLHMAKQSLPERQLHMLPSPRPWPPWGKVQKVEVVPEATKKCLIAFRENCHLLLVSSPSPLPPSTGGSSLESWG